MEQYKGWQIEFAGHLADGKWDTKAELEFHYGVGVYGRSVSNDDLFDTESEAKSESLRLAKHWIDKSGRIPMSKVNHAPFPFTFEIGDRVRSTLGDPIEGIVIEGYFSGEISRQYKVIYRVGVENEKFFEAEPVGLEKIEGS